MNKLEAAFRVGLDTAARICEQEQVAGAPGDESDSAYNLAIEHCVGAILAHPIPPEYAAPERKWVRAEDWRGEPNTTVALWVYRPSFRRSVFMLHLDVDEDGTLTWHREGALVTPVLPGDLPEPPKDDAE